MRKIVVKVGSSVIAPQGNLDSKLVGQLAKDVLLAERMGIKVILVSSGAIACGLHALGHKKKPADMHLLMAISSLGQIILMDEFNRQFKKLGLTCGQILLSWDDFEHRERFINIRKTIEHMLLLKAVPIINENDAVSSEEIKFGDNDRLSALVANLVEAEQLILLSDVEGLLDGKKVVKEVSGINAQILSLARIEDKTHTSGGMFTKLEAAKIATASGIKTTIACGRIKGIICHIAQGKTIGTLFLPASKKNKARKRWIAFSKKPKGAIIIDAGAKEAILNRKKSLLCVGIIRAERDFKRGDCVEVLDESRNILGCGLVNYSAQELINCRSKKFEKEAIHRDNFVAKD